MSLYFDSYCGLSCEDCDHGKSNQCGGCIASNGNPFHGTCEIAECAKTKGRRFCGECEHIPCEIISRYASDPEHGDNGARINRCLAIKAKLVEDARAGINPVGFCGHHCDFCFYSQWCGGCRSSYNCCSFATLFDSNTCPNVSCAKERGINGCYECSDLAECTKGFYGRENECVAAKAKALFIKKHGQACYTDTLKRADGADEGFFKAFDACESEECAITMLEKYIR